VLSAQTTHGFTDQELSHGVSIDVPGKANQSNQRIKGTSPVSGRIKAAGDTALTAITLQPGKEFYFEEDELAE